MISLIASKYPGQTCIRFVGPELDYSRKAALLYLDGRTEDAALAQELGVAATPTLITLKDGTKTQVTPNDLFESR